MAEKKNTIPGNSEILTEQNVKKEYNALRRMFRSVKDDDPDKMKLLERMIIHGLQTTTKNASQKFVKENPAVQTYDKYARSYASNMKTLIDMLPPKQKKEVSRVMQLRGDM